MTGASGGIGEALAHAFAREGYDLALVARSPDRLETVAAQLRASGAQAHVLVADLSTADAGEALEQAIVQRGLDVDVLVNNAGFGALGAFVDGRLDEQLGMIDLNVRVLTDLSWRFLQRMRSGGRGEGVLNVASTAAFQPGPHMAVYYASKAYVLSFTEALNQELKGSRLHATALCPGPVATGFQARAAFDDSVRLTKMMRPRPVAEVADAGVRAFHARRAVVIPGRMEQLMARSAAFAPRPVLLSMVEQLQRRRTTDPR